MVKRVFITGASSGIGLAMANLLVAEGHEIWGTSRNLERIPKIPRWHPVRLDLADPLFIEATFNAALTEAGYFDVVLNNAGAGHFDAAELVPLATSTRQFQPSDIRTESNQGVIKSAQANPRYDTKIARAWEVAERNMKSAPTPDLVARHVLRLVNSVQPPPRITVGNAFQSKIAPLIFRFLPQRLRLWGLKRHYQI